MADRVHPSNSPPRSTTSSNISDELPPSHPPKPTPPETQPPVPQPPGTYIFQIPKDQIYKYPPPENAQRYNSGKKTRQSCCRRCCCFTLCFLLVFIIALAIATTVLYLIYRPEAPEYTVIDVAIKGVNLTSTGPISPEFTLSMRANNKNNKLGIYYEKGSMVNLFYRDIELANGVMLVFYQTTNNVTVFRVPLQRSNVLLGNGVTTEMRSEQSKGRVPFFLKMRAPVKIKIGSVKTWEITVKVDCDITVDALTENSRIVSKDCDYGVRLW
ncbi:hypothetical protein Leryth_012881 [Lithospermum erythrorhizon]|nr:hypothetical protein Leryth_012881 [Lithospermum erythrorhizon]